MAKRVVSRASSHALRALLFGSNPYSTSPSPSAQSLAVPLVLRHAATHLARCSRARIPAAPRHLLRLRRAPSPRHPRARLTRILKDAFQGQPRPTLTVVGGGQ